MQEEAASCWIIDVLVCVAGKVHPVVLLHRIEHSCGRGLTVCEFCVHQSILCMSSEVLELPDSALQWATTWRGCLTNGEHLREAVGYDVVKHSRPWLVVVSGGMQGQKRQHASGTPCDVGKIACGIVLYNGL
ncbi:hypothetical protein AG1IA_10363 [Rhizoctonia solani AG-1 IA]|uniref:Uncharacterized protein n=1 Tax=Thanatephorus cucumeris (strain AG1-IA) TaxID=983506 RepID=L8WFW0_THACA|nr:hypothetical protein AG1IA_10363 [Rhizoctonia solani AG-1 IA]